jgi:hypothetical protein
MAGKNERLASLRALDLFGCGDLQPDLEAPANQVVAKPWLLRRASSSFVMSPPDLDFDLLAESRAALISVSNWTETLLGSNTRSS